MFAVPQDAKLNPGQWEQKLAGQTEPLQRLASIDQLAGHYAYTNVLRAQELLREQWSLLQQHEVEDFKFRYFLNKMAVLNQLYEFQEAATIAREAIDYLEIAGSIRQLTELRIEYAGLCSNLGELETADRLLQKVQKVLRQFPDQVLQSRLACRKGFLHLHSGNTAMATEQFLNAIAQLDSRTDGLHLRDEYFRTLAFAGLGQVYQQNDDYERSVKAFHQVVDRCERLGMTNRLAWHYLNLGRAHLGLQQHEPAKQLFQKVIDTRDDLSMQARASAYANLGRCVYEEDQLTEALELLQRAEHLHLELNPQDYDNLGIIATWRGRILMDQEDYEAAHAAFTEALNLAEANEDYKMQAELHADFAALYAETDDFKTAYEYQMAHDRLLELHLEEEDRRQRQELEIKYEAARRQQAAELLELKATRLQLKALRAQMNPHFIYNALNSIQSFISSQKGDIASRYLAKFAKLMRQSLEYSDVESITLEKEIEFLRDYLYINEKLRFDDRLSSRIIVDDDLEEDIMEVPTMIIQPYVENALEHGLRSRKDGLITLHFQLFDEHTICCIVEDNGIGRKKALALQMNDASRQNYRSRGTQITEKRLELLRQANSPELMVKTIDLYDEQSGEANGTRVEIYIPVVEV